MSEGNIEGAIEYVNQTWPEAFGKDPNLLFRLRCQQFVELVITQSGTQVVRTYQLNTCNVEAADPDAAVDTLMDFGRSLQEMLETQCQSLENERLAQVYNVNIILVLLTWVSGHVFSFSLQRSSKRANGAPFESTPPHTISTRVEQCTAR